MENNGWQARYEKEDEDKIMQAMGKYFKKKSEKEFPPSMITAHIGWVPSGVDHRKPLFSIEIRPRYADFEDKRGNLLNDLKKVLPDLKPHEGGYELVSKTRTGFSVFGTPKLLYTNIAEKDADVWNEVMFGQGVALG